MKALIIELRLYIAEKLMSWAYDIAPEKSVSGNEIKLTIAQYFDHLNDKRE